MTNKERKDRIQEMVNLIDGFGSEIYDMPSEQIALLVVALVENATLEEAFEAVSNTGLS